MNVCFDSNGNIDPNATFTLGQSGSQSGNGGLGSGGSSTNNNTCVTDGQVVTGDVPVSIATYSLQSVVQLPVPVPFLANPITLTASGTIQVQ
jgi:hypothetical protein